MSAKQGSFFNQLFLALGRENASRNPNHHEPDRLCKSRGD